MDERRGGAVAGSSAPAGAVPAAGAASAGPGAAGAARRPPDRLYLEVTRRCPLACRHCSSIPGPGPADELSLAELLGLIDQAEAMGVPSLVVSGGEPLLRSDLFAVLARARSHGLAVSLLTNGLPVDRRIAVRLAKMGVRVKVSLDGVTAATHDALRGEGTFHRTLRALELLRSAGVEDLAVHWTLHRGNCAELHQLPPLLLQLRISDLVVGTIKAAGRAAMNPELLIPPAMVPYLRLRLEAIARHPGIRLLRFGERIGEGFGCPAICSKFGITAEGRTTVCVFLGTDWLGGSVREKPLAELWRARTAQDGAFVANPRCAACPALPATGGGCRARAQHLTGDLNAPDPYCCAAHAQRQFLERHPGLLEGELAGRAAAAGHRPSRRR